MPASSKSSNSSSSSRSDGSSAALTCNEGETTDCEVEVAATARLRGRAALVTASCPRQYLRGVSDRKAAVAKIPADMEDAKDFLSAFRRIAASHCQQRVEMAASLATFHTRRRKSTQQPERKLYIAVRMDNNFPHARVAEAFKAKHGISIKFSFKLDGFGAVLRHMMGASGQTTDEFEKSVAKYPANFSLEHELAAGAVVLPVSTKAPDNAWQENEGESTDAEEEVPADQALRGETALVTAACPRQYPADQQARRAEGTMIPEDFSKEEFLTNLRRIFGSHCTVKVLKATCHSEPHKRCNKTTKKRERHFHVALKVTGNFAHKRVAAAFHKAHGLRISFSFKLNRFVGNLQYLMVPGKKPSTDLDLKPAVYPPTLKPEEELKAASHPGDRSAKESRKRKRLSFDEVSDVIFEGVGDGPIRSAEALEEAARTLKRRGQIELWNYLGSLKTNSDTAALVAKVWHLHGESAHAMWITKPEFGKDMFHCTNLQQVNEWLQGKWKTHVLVLSGDGGLGKTSLAEALMMIVSPDGYWFVDDPDDFRELEGLLKQGQGFIVDEISLADFKPNQIKKLYDVVKTRRVKCRHFNATIPKGCPRIYCTNDTLEKFYPPMKNQQDRTGVFRRHLFQVVVQDVRVFQGAPVATVGKHAPAGAAASSSGASWRDTLQTMCSNGKVDYHFAAAVRVAEDLCVALANELTDVAADIADGVGMKVLERRRFLSQ